MTLNTNKISSNSVVQCRRLGRIVVVNCYIITAEACARSDKLAEFNGLTFFNNYFTTATCTDGTLANVVLAGNTNELRADGAISSGKTFTVQIIGITTNW